MVLDYGNFLLTAIQSQAVVCIKQQVSRKDGMMRRKHFCVMRRISRRDDDFDEAREYH
jgi:hypothetical protein